MKNFLLVFRIGLFITLQVGVLYSASATHLMGGELTYTHNNSTANGTYYDVKLLVYRYCDTTSGVPAALDTAMKLGAFVKQNQGNPNMIYWQSTWILPLVSATIISAPPGNSSCLFQPTACVERGEYLVTIFLPINQSGYHLLVERCCRNGTILNLTNPGGTGMTFYATVPAGIINSSPQISDISVPFICSNDTTTIINNAFDPDGDSLAYTFVIPFAGTSAANGNAPDPAMLSPYTLPILPVSFAPGYSVFSPFGGSGYASIHPVNGMTRYFIPNQGLYVVAIEIKEYRNGVLIGAIRRDLQYITIVCPPNTLPLISSTNPGGVYTVAENQQLCFDVIATDADGDSLFLFADGPLLNAGMVNPPGVINNAVGAGTVTSTFCWTPICGMSQSVPYEFFVTVIDKGCPPKSNSQIFSVFVTGGAPSVPPVIIIHQDTSGIICQGSPVTLYATCNLPGTAPVFSWFINGVQDFSSIDSIFTSTGLINGDVVTVTIVSNASCLTTNSATSPPYVVTISTQPLAQVSISSFPPNLCPVQNCLFTATVNNGGINPSYQWYVNGNASGLDLQTFSASTTGGYLNVYVAVTPSTGCPSQLSDTISYFVGPMLTPVVAVSANVIDSICQGQQVVFNAFASNTGLPPVFDWLLNGTSLGIPSNDSLVLSNLNEGDFISVAVTSTYSCLSPFPAYSNILSYHLYPLLQLNLIDGPIESCTGAAVLLQAAATGGNSSALDYYWSAGTSSGPDNSFVPAVSGYYYVIADDHCNIPVSDSVYIELLPSPDAGFFWTPEFPSELLPEVTFADASVDAIQWFWDFGDLTSSGIQNPIHSYLNSGLFPVELIVTNALGCTDSIIKNLEVKKAITIYIPNSFTPNGDGINDEFGVVASEGTNCTLSIYGRWGNEIYTSSSPLNKWNGLNSNSKKAPSGTYLYRVLVSDGSYNEIFSGTVSLIR